ncbi:trypsin-like serine protease [Corynebacterium sp. zg-331]|uniref:trypsin-like serine protease n=1 Tax=unclassified Corynebacterium TaxID=2624378 RepID=UPI00128E4848|nr:MULTISPECIES: trypsin-like serine protease [unclassified Corynebacterium]MBC3186405.1 trypsin-like serine protease [Corynebacterium sp. zg-331]MPV52890.1 trypsin-like serine protease [Corynebacterium sp. zg331]
MKITRALFGVAIALSATLTPAAHASTIVHQAMAIKAAEGYQCTLTVVDETTAYTALHCGFGNWRVGDTIRSLDTGQPLGTITALGSDLAQPLDAVQIALDPDVQVADEVARGDSAALRTGDIVQFQAPGNYAVGVITEDVPRYVSVGSNLYPSLLINSNVVTYAGNSGGPLMDEEGNVVAVLSAGNQEDNSLFTPLHLIEEGFGEHSRDTRSS